MPMMKPLVVCVTRQAELARQPVSASRSKGSIHCSVPACAARETFGGEWRQSTPPPLHSRSGVALALLPLGFELEDGLPVTSLNLRHVGFLRDRGAPADRIADQRLVFAAHRDGAVGAERRLDLQAAQGFRNLLAVG